MNAFPKFLMHWRVLILVSNNNVVHMSVGNRDISMHALGHGQGNDPSRHNAASAQSGLHAHIEEMIETPVESHAEKGTESSPSASHSTTHARSPVQDGSQSYDESVFAARPPSPGHFSTTTSEQTNIDANRSPTPNGSEPPIDASSPEPESSADDLIAHFKELELIDEDHH